MSNAEPSTDEVARAGVVVAGMHRSGTSAVTRLINLVGVLLPNRSDLWLELPGNERGYWESSSLARFNEHLLGLTNSTWWCPPPLGWTHQLIHRSDLIAKAQHAFYAVHSSGCWLWKDPRTSLTLPLWRQALSDSFVGVLVFRHPLEVAASLAQRDGLPMLWSLALWERYNRSVLAGLRGLPVCVVPYEAILRYPTDWYLRLSSFLKRYGVIDEPSSAGLVEAEKFLDCTLRHTEYSETDLLLDANVTAAQIALYFILLRCGKHHSAFQVPQLPSESPSTSEIFERIRRRGKRNLREQIQRWIEVCSE